MRTNSSFGDAMVTSSTAARRALAPIAAASRDGGVKMRIAGDRAVVELR